MFKKLKAFTVPLAQLVTMCNLSHKACCMRVCSNSCNWLQEACWLLLRQHAGVHITGQVGFRLSLAMHCSEHDQPFSDIVLSCRTAC